MNEIFAFFLQRFICEIFRNSVELKTLLI